MTTRFPHDPHTTPYKVCELSLQCSTSVLAPDQKRQDEKQKLLQQEEEQARREATANAVRKAVRSDDILEQLKDAELVHLKQEMQSIKGILQKKRFF